MKIQANSLCLALCLSLPAATALVALTSCVSGHYDLGTHEQMDDPSLQLRVATALSDNPDYKFAGVTITASNGLVRLAGSVDLPTQKVKAGDIVIHISGVRHVEDNIIVKNENAKAKGGSDEDKSLTAIVKSVLDNNPDYRYEEVNVAVFQGTVQLGGFVNTADQKNRAGDLARTVPGVKDVMNNITVKAVL